MAMRSGRDLRDPNELRRLRELRHQERLDARGGGGSGGRGGVLVVLVLGAIVLAIGAGAVVSAFTILRPVVRDVVVALAGDNPSALGIGFVREFVGEDIGAALTAPASLDPEQVPFTVVAGDTAAAIAERLAREGLLLDERAFVLVAVEKGVATKLEAGDYVLRRNMTPEELVGALLLAERPSVVLTLREGLRLEQITAKLQTMPLQLDPQEFYQFASEPPASLLARVPWLELPEGRSLEGYLYPDTYRILADTSAEELLGILLDRFREVVGDERMTVPEKRGLTFYQVLTLASLVEQEVRLDAERPLIAGVYQNRLTEKMLLQADPTVIYAKDTVALAELPFEEWQRYVFWEPVGSPLAEYAVPKALAGYQTYKKKGLMPGPISTPSVASIDAALAPDTSDGYLYFVATGDKAGTHAFAKTYKQHLANLKKYGYQ